MNIAGPKVSGVTLQKTGHKIIGLVIISTSRLPAAAAGNVANYAVQLLSMGRRNLYGQRSLKTGKAVRVSAVQYDAEHAGSHADVPLAASRPARCSSSR